MSHFWVRTEDGHIQRVGHFQVVLVKKPSDNVGLPALNQGFDPFDGLGTVFQDGGQGQVAVLQEDNISLVKRCSSSSLLCEANL